ncbi:MAG: phosphomannomutase/phosphoglucomutase [Nanoarchaeota archaeon]
MTNKIPINPDIFRAYDIRGLAPQELNERTGYLIGLEYGRFLKDAKRISVGYDIRKSGPTIKKGIIQGLADAGKIVVDIGCVPTPMSYFSVCHYNLDGGIQITGSHNPPQYNGIKLQKGNAECIYAENGIYDIRDRVVAQRDLPKTTAPQVTALDCTQDYIDYLSARLMLKRPLSIVIDNGNGTCGLIPERIFRSKGCKVKTIFAEPDDTFPNHIPDPSKIATLKALQKEVVKTGADVGLAFDGDGDRVGIVDARGRVVSADHILMLLARQALASRKGNVVIEVRASRTLIQDIKSHGGVPIMVPAGRAFVRDGMDRSRAVFGGELTGHIFYPMNHYQYDDGMFIALKLAEIVASTDFCGLVDSLPTSHKSEDIGVMVADRVKFDVVKKLTKRAKDQGLEVLDIDGARITFKEGWALVRASNTTQMVKVLAEGDTKSALDSILKEVFAMLSDLGVDVSKRDAH